MENYKIVRVAKKTALGSLKRSDHMKHIVEAQKCLQERVYDSIIGWPIGLERHLSDLECFSNVLEDKTLKTYRDFGIVNIFDGVQQKQYNDSELGAYRAYNIEKFPTYDFESFIRISEVLGGGSKIRNTDKLSTIAESGHRTMYLDVDDVHDRMEEVFLFVNNVDSSRNAINAAIEVYLEICTIHPLDDGNGRMARLFANIVLSKLVGNTYPILPLHPMIDNNKSSIYNAFLHWYKMEQPEVLQDCFVRLVFHSIPLLIQFGLLSNDLRR